MEYRNGLVIEPRLCLASGTDVHAFPTRTLFRSPGAGRITVGADKNYDTANWVQQVRACGATPHVAQNNTHRRSAIDERTTRHPGYALSQKKRKRVEEILGWMKTVALMRQVRHRGRQRVAWMFTWAAAAYNLTRLRNLIGATA